MAPDTYHVAVSYDPDAPIGERVTVDKDPLDVEFGVAKIQWKPAPGQEGQWEFRRNNLTGLHPPTFKGKRVESHEMEIEDENDRPDRHRPFDYAIFINADGETHRHDPQINNQPR